MSFSEDQGKYWRGVTPFITSSITSSNCMRDAIALHQQVICLDNKVVFAVFLAKKIIIDASRAKPT